MEQQLSQRFFRYFHRIQGDDSLPGGQSRSFGKHSQPQQFAETQPAA